jgi:DNA-binding transcriptional LysR family regulator
MSSPFCKTQAKAILTAVLADGGIDLVCDFVTRLALNKAEVVQVSVNWDLMAPYMGPAYAVYKHGKHLAPKIRASIDFFLVA